MCFRGGHNVISCKVKPSLQIRIFFTMFISSCDVTCMKPPVYIERCDGANDFSVAVSDILTRLLTVTLFRCRQRAPGLSVSAGAARGQAERGRGQSNRQKVRILIFRLYTIVVQDAIHIRGLPENFPRLLFLLDSIKTRQAALTSLRLSLSSHILADVLTERRVTLMDALERCLKKGKEEEQSLAASVLSLLCIQLGSGPEGEEVFHCLKPILISILTDSSTGSSARQSCATSLGLCCYIAAADAEDLISSLCCLEGLITSYYSDNGAKHTALHGLLCCAIQSWALLLTMCPASRIQKVLESHLPRLPGMLSSENVNLRIAAGESLALLYELGRDLEEDFFYEDTDALCVTLKALATDSNKYRAKTDRRKQRSIFRDVLHYIESSECQEETIKFGLEVMYVDSWVRRRTYSSFKEVLGSGVRYHLQYNEVLRDIFSLGAPLVLDAAAIKANKISRVEKVREAACLEFPCLDSRRSPYWHQW
uniref:Interferon related developmental regulator 2 n=1 Tax=Leptobrachium leishanense TaxID=445787 RepID=A0A8C5N291_9ANUR